jgi:glutaredoxin-like YruB-family protein
MTEKAKHDVKVYSTPFCPWCTKAKEYLKEKGVPFEEVNVMEDRQAAEDMVKRSGQTGVPVIEIDGKMIVGFNLDEINKALDIKE